MQQVLSYKSSGIHEALQKLESLFETGSESESFNTAFREAVARLQATWLTDPAQAENVHEALPDNLQWMLGALTFQALNVCQRKHEALVMWMQPIQIKAKDRLPSVIELQPSLTKIHARHAVRVQLNEAYPESKDLPIYSKPFSAIVFLEKLISSAQLRMMGMSTVIALPHLLIASSDESDEDLPVDVDLGPMQEPDSDVYYLPFVAALRDTTLQPPPFSEKAATEFKNWIRENLTEAQAEEISITRPPILMAEAIAER